MDHDGVTEHPARPMVARSWLDGLIDRVTGQRVPWWVLVVVIWAIDVALVGLFTGVIGKAGRDVTVFQMSQAFYGVASLVGYGVLTRVADRAYTRFLPAVGAGNGEAERWHRSLTSMSNRMATVAVTVGALVGILAGGFEPRATEVFDTSPLGGVLMFALNYCFNVAGAAVVLVHLVRVARGVSRLHRLGSEIDLFSPAPAHAFAGVTGLGGAFLILVMTYSALTDPATFENPVWLAMVAWGPVLAILLFLLPLTGMRRRLRTQKRALLDASMVRIRRTAAVLDAAVDQGRYDEVATLKTALDALERERDRIQETSTLPWEGRTLRAFASTLLLPLVSWLVTSVAGRVLGL